MDNMALFLAIILTIIIMVPFLIWRSSSQEKTKNMLRSFAPPEEKIIGEQIDTVSYLGGLPGYSDWRYGSMIITDKRIVFSYSGLKKEATINIPYEIMTAVSLETQETITAARIVAFGIFAPWWKKNVPFVAIKIKNEIGETSMLGFGFKSPGWSSKNWFEEISSWRFKWFKENRPQQES